MTQAAPVAMSKTVFFHIMKTGGTTFQAILKAIYGDGFHICQERSVESIGAALAKYDCMEFHMLATAGDWIYLHAELVEQRRWNLLAGRESFTMLRDPVDQVMSQYYYAVSIREHIEPIFVANGIAFPESLEEYLQSPTVYNNQAAFLAGRSQLRGTPIDGGDLSLVKEMIAKVGMRVGRAERFADSMNVFETVTGLKVPDRVIRNQNRNRNRPKLEAESGRLREMIRERSGLDVELYALGCELLEQDLARCGATRDYAFLKRGAVEPLCDAARNSAARAVAYLAGSQLAGGEWQRSWVVGQRIEDGQTVEEHASCSCPFMTALILYSLQFAKGLDAAGEASFQRGLQFLAGDMDTGGLWRFPAKNSPKRVRVPPDLDDTACAAQVLVANGISIPDNKGLFYDTRDARGLFLTWLTKPNSLRKWVLHLRTRGSAFSNAEDMWSPTVDSVCAVVNANVVLYLGETSGTRKAIEWLLQIFRDGTEDREMVFYAHRLSLYYMTSRALFNGVTALDEAKPIMLERIAALREPDGAYGDELLTAMAVCSLLNLGAGTEGMDGAIAHLMTTQREDGSWQRVPMYGGPPVPNVLGSIDLTTGMCAEALARYSAAAKGSQA